LLDLDWLLNANSLNLQPEIVSFIDKLKKRWQVTSAWQVLIILVVFACTGYSIVLIKHLLGIKSGSDSTTRILFSISKNDSFQGLPIFLKRNHETK
jgi:hypothetical protein